MVPITPQQSFGQELENLQGKVLQAGTGVAQALEKAFKALILREGPSAREALEYLREIRWDMEEDCLRLLATQQPMGKDLRKIVAALRASQVLQNLSFGVREFFFHFQEIFGNLGSDPISSLPSMEGWPSGIRTLTEGILSAYGEVNGETMQPYRPYWICKPSIGNPCPCCFSNIKKQGDNPFLLYYLLFMVFLNQILASLLSLAQEVIQLSIGERIDFREALLPD